MTTSKTISHNLLSSIGLFFILLLTFCTVQLYAQTKIASQIPESYKYDLSQLVSKKERKKPDSKEERKRLKQAYKRLKKEMKLKSRLYKLKTDSLKNMRKLLKQTDWNNKHLAGLPAVGQFGPQAGLKEKKARMQEKLERNVDPDILEGLSKAGKHKKDIKKIASGDTAYVKEKVVNEVTTRYGKGLPVDVSRIDSSYFNWDSLMTKEFTPPSELMAQFKDEFSELEQMKAFEKEIKSMPNMLRQQKPQQSLQGQDMMKEMQLQNQIGEYIPKEYHDFFETNKSKLKKARQTVKVAREKPKPKEIIRSFFRQDMKGLKMEPTFKERLHLAGFFEIKKAKPLLLSANPSVGYRFTERITAGLGANYRFYVGDGEDLQRDNGYAYQFFFDYRISPAFYMHSEYENSVRKANHEALHSKLQTNYYIGLGRDLNYKNQLKASILLLYNFSSDRSSANMRDRISVRTGFRIN